MQFQTFNSLLYVHKQSQAAVNITWLWTFTVRYNILTSTALTHFPPPQKNPSLVIFKNNWKWVTCNTLLWQRGWPPGALKLFHDLLLPGPLHCEMYWKEREYAKMKANIRQSFLGPDTFSLIHILHRISLFSRFILSFQNHKFSSFMQFPFPSTYFTIMHYDRNLYFAQLTNSFKIFLLFKLWEE